MARALAYLVGCVFATILGATMIFISSPAASSSLAVVKDRPPIDDLEKQRTSNEASSSSYHYGVIIDAGSSGSRVFVYIWPTSGTVAGELIQIDPLIDRETGRAVVKKVSPGLSSYGENATGAVDHVVQLLRYAESKIPLEKHKETSLFLMATAGMRLLPQSQQDAILKELREELPKTCDFIIMDQHIEVISGKWEGIYSWIAVNYALERFDNTKKMIDPSLEMIPILDEKSNITLYRKPTVGMIDMGGGSVQIAFETDEQVPRMQEHMTVNLNLGFDERDILHRYKLYVTTFLGYGANEAITRYEKKLAERLAQNAALPTTTPPVVKDPCLPLNLYSTVTLLDKNNNDDESSSSDNNVETTTFTRKGVGNYDQCRSALRTLLNPGGKVCLQSPCSFDGVYQPKINFTATEFYGFSEYWYTTNDVLDVGGRYSHDRLTQEASKFCSSKWSTLKHAFDNRLYPRADLQRMKNECIKSAWISTVLHDGFGFPLNVTKFQTVSQINGEEVQWTIGALLYRMRHFPLREMQRLRELQPVHPSNSKNNKYPYQKMQSSASSSSYISLVLSNSLSQLLLLICIGTVVLSTVKYFCFLRRYKRSSPSFSSSSNNSFWNNIGFTSVIFSNNNGLAMPRNRSMYSYMTMDTVGGNGDDSSPYLDGVRIERSQYIY